MEVLLSHTILRPEEKRIISSLEKKGLTVKTHSDRNGFSDLGFNSEKPKVALIRSMSHKIAEQSANMLKLTDVMTINSSDAIQTCANKALQATRFQKNKIPQPDFQIAYKLEDVFSMGTALGGDFVVKPVDASWGRGIARLTSHKCFETWSAGRESVDPNAKSFPVLIQKFVEKGNFDIRVVIVGQQPIVAFKRVSAHWKTNTHLGATVEPIDLNENIRELSHEVIRMLGPGIYGLDLFEEQTTNKLLVCEVNQNPEFHKSSQIHGVDVADKIANYVSELI
jgi:[lysine-biosynthesis-protein LysW]--L-2-aminoadipate ligase